MFDLFAGCGGLSAGLENHGFLPLLVSELNKDALGSYLVNRSFRVGQRPFNKLSELHFQDIYDLDTQAIRKVELSLADLGIKLDFTRLDSSLDLICGGPPCQGYSGIGHRRSYAVEKKDIPSNQLYEKMAEIIEHFRPKLFLFENVRGLLSSRWTMDGEKGEIWKDVQSRFHQIKRYHTRFTLLHAKDYGVPQNRPRILLVGIRDDVAANSDIVDLDADAEDAVKCGLLPAPTGGAPNPGELLDDLVDRRTKKCLLTNDFPRHFLTSKYLRDPLNETQERLRTRPDRTIMGKGDDLTEQQYSKHKPQIVQKFLHMQATGGIIPDVYKTKKFAQRVIPRRWGDKGPSITATSLPDDYVHYSQPRSLTVREWARLQTFPDWYQFCGSRTTGGLRRAGNPRAGVFDREVPKYTQIGNAVPVALAQKVGEHFRKIIG